ncbi:hypothetical protein EHS25_005152 [Saitozyma podzolica]|uniref:Uncharacterized protein n=1 Tax=Saitozyma podzolica TaxID=1890683 RepID=A0A427XYF0_9TREE|nr:hypothetical protein EHS25_005152 [Saitozyma podzolica]
MPAYGPEYWTNNPSPYKDCAGQEWPLRDTSLANSDHIAFLVALEPLSGRPGLYTTLDASTVSYDSHGVRHVQTPHSWRTVDDPLRAGTVNSLEAWHIPPAHIDYNLLARQTLSTEKDSYDEGGSTLDPELCQRALAMAQKIERLSCVDPMCPEASEAKGVLECIFVAHRTQSSKRDWHIGKPTGSLTKTKRRAIRYNYTDPEGGHIVTIKQLGGYDDVEVLEAEDAPHSEVQTIRVDEAGIKSRVETILAEAAKDFFKATRTVAAETERDERPLSVKTSCDMALSLTHFSTLLTVQSESEPARADRLGFSTEYRR